MMRGEVFPTHSIEESGYTKRSGRAEGIKRRQGKKGICNNGRNRQYKERREQEKRQAGEVGQEINDMVYTKRRR